MNIGATTYGARSALLVSRNNPAAASALAQNKTDESSNPFKKDASETAQVGFGKNTVSVPGIALETVDRGLTSARDIVPTADDVREKLRARAARQREERLAQVEQRREEAKAEAKAAATMETQTAGEKIEENAENAAILAPSQDTEAAPAMQAAPATQAQSNAFANRYPAMDTQAANTAPRALDVTA